MIAAGLIEALVVPFWNPGRKIVVLEMFYAALVSAIALFLAHRPIRLARHADTAVIAGSFLVAIIVAQVALEAYPNSADEYGYTYLAETLAHGRLWNQAYPPELRDVLATAYIGGHGDQRLSQYAPGWPAVLIPFQLIGIPQFANAVVGLVAAIFLRCALQTLNLPRPVQFAALVFGVAAPFTILNDASFFNHPLTAAALLGVIWLDLLDIGRPALLNRVGIGFAFSVLLLTRYEAFLIAFGLFVIDGLVRRRTRFVGWALPAALGAAPLTLALLAYDWAITGSPFVTTLTWISPDIGYGLHASGINGPHSAARGLSHTLVWFGSWLDYASALLLPLYVVALRYRIAARTLRWFDLLWPAVVVFFFFYPDSGGYQYGPRYWYIAHAALPITIAAALPMEGEWWRLGRFRIHPGALAIAQIASFAGFIVGASYFLYVQTENRLVPPRVAATAPTPAMVLVPEFKWRRFVSWQSDEHVMTGNDYTRNGIGALGPLVMGLDLGDERTKLLCGQVPDRAIYRLVYAQIGPTGSLDPVCNGAVSAIQSKETSR